MSRVKQGLLVGLFLSYLLLDQLPKFPGVSCIKSNFQSFLIKGLF
jgi:hypothetical protein